MVQHWRGLARCASRRFERFRRLARG
jgi:hypothetical protein